MAHTILVWENDAAEANDVKYKLKKDEQTGWWQAWAFLPSLSQPVRVSGYNNHGSKADAMRLAQEDSEKRGEILTAREPQIKRVRA